MRDELAHIELLRENQPGHFGLESMRSRAEEIGADLSISSARGRGTIVRVELPVENGAR